MLIVRRHRHALRRFERSIPIGALACEVLDSLLEITEPFLGVRQMRQCSLFPAI